MGVAWELSDEELVKWLKLTVVKSGLGPVRIQKLFTTFKNLSGIYNATRAELLDSRIVNEKIVDSFEKLKSANDSNFYQLIETCRENNFKVFTYINKDYPEKLKNIPSPPLTLYLSGDEKIISSFPSIGIVGTREPSKQARDLAYSYSKSLSDRSITVISGGAIGIDTAAHFGVLDSKYKKTICILASGFLQPYPPENKELFKNIVEAGGLLISENSPNFPGTDISLVQRNRITSGLADAIFIVAAKGTGGGLEQVKIASKQRKPIFCTKLNLDIIPNEGIKIAIEKYKAIEIENVDQLVNYIHSD